MEALKKRMATLREEKERALTDLETVKEKLREAERETAAVRCLVVDGAVCLLVCAQDGSNMFEQL